MCFDNGGKFKELKDKNCSNLSNNKAIADMNADIFQTFRNITLYNDAVFNYLKNIGKNGLTKFRMRYLLKI